MSVARLKSLLVVVTDPFAREQPALTKAAAIARRCGARVLIFNSFMIPQPVTDVPMDSREQIIESAIRQRRRHLTQLASRLRLRGAKCVVQWDFPTHEAIVRLVLKTKPDLLVTESHRHGRLARLILANTDWELIRACPCPLWFVRSASLPRQPQLLVAVDPRHSHAKPARLDDRLLQTAQLLEKQLGAHTAVVHAYETPVSAVPGMLMEPIRLPIPVQRTRDFVAATNAAVGRLAAKYGIGDADCSVQEGNARDVIAAVARRRRTDVLLMGAVSRSRLERPIIGNTAESVIDHVDCDVVVVKPAGFRTPVQRAARKR